MLTEFVGPIEKLLLFKLIYPVFAVLANASETEDVEDLILFVKPAPLISNGYAGIVLFIPT